MGVRKRLDAFASLQRWHHLLRFAVFAVIGLLSLLTSHYSCISLFDYCMRGVFA
jgi:hypothetical protein